MLTKMFRSAFIRIYGGVYNTVNNGVSLLMWSLIPVGSISGMVPTLLVSGYAHHMLSTDVDFDYHNVNYNSVILPEKLLRAVRRTATVKYVFNECTNSFRKERILMKHTTRLTCLTRYMNYYVCKSNMAFRICNPSEKIRAHNHMHQTGWGLGVRREVVGCSTWTSVSWGLSWVGPWTQLLGSCGLKVRLCNFSHW